MTGGYAIMTFRLRGHGGPPVCLTHADIYGKTSANKRMSGGGNQKQFKANEIGKSNVISRAIAKRNPRYFDKNVFSFKYQCNKK